MDVSVYLVQDSVPFGQAGDMLIELEEYRLRLELLKSPAAIDALLDVQFAVC